MPVNKLQRFAEIRQMDHVLEHIDFQSKKAEKPKGNWNKEIFGNANPVTLELGCGKGNLTTSLAALYSEKNFIGIDIKGARLWKGAKRATAEHLKNVRFLRIYVEYLTEYFATNEADEIWITFPDPYPRPSDRNKRLTSPRFLEMYGQILKPRGFIHFKTDDSNLFQYTVKTIAESGGKVLKSIEDLYDEKVENPHLAIQTAFEKKHLANQKTIKYCKFKLYD